MKMLNADEKNGLKADWQNALKEKKILDNIYAITNRKTGVLYKVHVKTNPILVAGSLKGYVGTVEDVTERERAHEIVQESELWFRNIADNAPVMIWSTDRELNFNYFNDRWLKYTGHTYEEEAGAEWINNVFEEDRKRVLNVLKIAAKKREPFRLEFRLNIIAATTAG